MRINSQKIYKQYRYYFLKSRRFYEKPKVKASGDLLFSLMIISFFTFFAIRPTLTTIFKLMKELEDKKEINQKLDQKIADLNKAQMTYGKVVNDLPLVEAALPEKVAFEALTSRINYLSFIHQLKLVLASFDDFDLLTSGEEETEKEYWGAGVLNFKLSLTGSYLNIKNFLKDLEVIDRMVVIDSTVFFNEKRGEIQIDIEGKSFWLAETFSLKEKEEL